ncbi:MAG: hypothetical protein M3362_18905 [Acidobacteriota bacterium]|nr:hypothetical protein [Acidobacteriota bacterium]
MSILSFDAFSEAIEEKAKAAKEAEQQKMQMAEFHARQLAVEQQLKALADALRKAIPVHYDGLNSEWLETRSEIYESVREHAAAGSQK